MADLEPASDTSGQSPEPDRAGRAVPSPLGRKVLAFEFVVLLEYWLSPLFLGLTNYAGVWSDVGNLLFIVFTGSILVFVVWPLLPRLRAASGHWRPRVVFHGIWITAFLVGLFATNIFQFEDGPSSPAVQLGQSTVYSPFGAWSSLTVYVPSMHLWATFNPEGPTVLGLLAVLSAASIVLGTRPAMRACSSDAPAGRGWRSRLASAGILAPLGFISGCPGCAPFYFAALAAVAPGVAERAAGSIPLVPWIGFAGLLYLLGYWLAVHLIHRATGADPMRPSSPDAG